MQFADNGLSLYDLLYEKESDEVFTLRQVANLDIHGHRGDVRSLTFSRQQNYLLSVASSCTGKIWQVSNNLCLRTLSLSGYGTCCLFVCNDIFTVIGTKNGTLEIHCTLTGDSVLQLADHEGPIWSVCESSDEKYLFTGGSDKKIHIYEMVICSTTSGTIPTIQLEPIRTLEMSDEVLCLKTTPDGKLLIVALLDCTVRSFYLDSLRFYLSFYGHKMPVLSMDVTSDSYLLITGSADKSIKIWGLDFGDLHKSLLGHENAVMNITCQPNTHYFFSASRDGLIKYWDADVFQLLMNLKGHSGEVWTLAISSNGEILASAGHDKSIRQWRRTNEQLFLEEEEEARMDEALANSVIQERRRSVSNLEASVHHITLGMESIPEVVSATTLNHMDVVENCEKILETLQLVQKECEREQEEPEEAPDIQLLGLSRHMYLLRTLSKIRITDLESVLMLLPYYAAEQLLSFCSELLRLPCSRLYADLLCRVILFLTQSHRSVMIHGIDRGQMEYLTQGIHQLLSRSKKKVGFNIAALKMILKDEAVPRTVTMENDEKTFFYDNQTNKKRRRSKSKRGENLSSHSTL